MKELYSDRYDPVTLQYTVVSGMETLPACIKQRYLFKQVLLVGKQVGRHVKVYHHTLKKSCALQILEIHWKLVGNRYFPRFWIFPKNLQWMSIFFDVPRWLYSVIPWSPRCSLFHEGHLTSNIPRESLRPLKCHCLRKPGRVERWDRPIPFRLLSFITYRNRLRMVVFKVWFRLLLESWPPPLVLHQNRPERR